ncbi:MAG: adenylate/guanylate cyclase domain-containing protein [Chloroflexi bacterium]|nr:adenylate/guanylate cyclase domain-containing protein [Chloroflexota bacterium]
MAEAGVPAVADSHAGPLTLAFLFSDIEGSTKLQEQLGTAAYAKVLDRHSALLRSAFEAHGGQEQGTEGDSFFVVFESAREAVAAAIEAQRALAGEAWPEDGEVRVRMGIHAGEARPTASGLVGLDITRAARIAAAANGGQIVVSEAVRQLAGADLGPGVSLRGLGRHRLKDLREPQPLCQVVAEGLRMEFPPIRSLDARPNNLPTQLTSFIGRERELEEAGRLLEGSRLVTLTGPGGTGKTRLGLQVAANASDRFPDGIFFVALETVREPALLLPRIASAIGLAENRMDEAGGTLREWLAGKEVLLVLDNFEQVVAAGPIVADLLRDAPGLSVIVTSRAPLRVSGEQEYPVPGLPVPPDPSQMSAMERARMPAGALALDPATLTTFEAIKLFIARAGAVRPGFAVTNDNAPAVAASVARLHGMPLAIELAAARTKLLSPEAIQSRLESQLGLLSGGARALPERQQTLRGAIAWSYDLLDDGQRALLDRLSVFAGGFDLEAAEAICGPADEVGVEIVDGLISLADQSLIRSAEADGEPRFSMLDTIRQYAAEMLDARGETRRLRDAHARWYLAVAERLGPELAGAEQGSLLDRIEADHDNFRAVLDHATAIGDGDTAIRMAYAIWRFWQKRGHLYEARRRVDAIVRADWSRDDPRLRARLLEVLGGICWWQADIESMRVAYTEALALWRELDDKAELANALYNYSFIFLVPTSADAELTELDPEGERVLQEALALYRELDDPRGQANALWGLGNRKYFSDHPDAGIDEYRAALELTRQAGERTMEAWSLHMLGSALLRRGTPDESRPLLQHALRHFHAAGDAAGITMLLDDLSSQAVAEEDLRRAAQLWGAARNLTAVTGAALAGFTDEWIEGKVRPNVRGSVQPEDLERWAREGAMMPLDDVVAYALDASVESLAEPIAEPA